MLCSCAQLGGKGNATAGSNKYIGDENASCGEGENVGRTQLNGQGPKKHARLGEMSGIGNGVLAEMKLNVGWRNEDGNFWVLLRKVNQRRARKVRRLSTQYGKSEAWAWGGLNHGVRWGRGREREMTGDSCGGRLAEVETDVLIGGEWVRPTTKRGERER